MTPPRPSAFQSTRRFFLKVVGIAASSRDPEAEALRSRPERPAYALSRFLPQ